ncbi:hypothetical protein JNUCC0626_41110 [Lentzea sp. JNUCC 0626]|uniref:hypothetical protein n=1 Tax=Lentzea sp. JNUCC 0626 TaxID=3367513 RepID=UPI00374A6F94
MAGAVGIVFGLCVLSFTLGAALMYVLVRRREDARDKAGAVAEAVASPEVPVDARTWVEKPVVEAVDAEYDSRPIHRNPVVGLPQLEPALAVFAEPVVVEPEAVKPEVAAEVEPVVEVPEPEAEPEVEVVEELEVEAEVEVEPEIEPEVVVETALPPPARPQAVEQTTWVEREDFRQRYLRTFDEVRRKAGSN